MKFLSILLFFLTFPALADEVCRSSENDFFITDSYIEARGQGERVRIPHSHVRSLSRRRQNDFKDLINILKDQMETDQVLSETEILSLDRFALTVANGTKEIVSMMYVKGYDREGQLIVRYMVTGNGSYRCL